MTGSALAAVAVATAMGSGIALTVDGSGRPDDSADVALTRGNVTVTGKKARLGDGLRIRLQTSSGKAKRATLSADFDLAVVNGTWVLGGLLYPPVDEVVLTAPDGSAVPTAVGRNGWLALLEAGEFRTVAIEFRANGKTFERNSFELANFLPSRWTAYGPLASD